MYCLSFAFCLGYCDFILTVFSYIFSLFERMLKKITKYEAKNLET